MDQNEAKSAEPRSTAPGGQIPAEVQLQLQIEHRFAAHKVSDADAKAMQDIREACKATALIIAARTKIGRDQSSALTHLDLAMYHANASIARKGR